MRDNEDFMDDSLTALFKSISASQNVDYYWMRGIVKQESDENPYALRYEVNYNYLLNPTFYAKRLGLSLTTEINTQKMSWGLCQIMGALAREQGFSDEIGKLFIPEINLEHLAKRITKLMTFSKDESDVFAMYNGGEGAFHKLNGVYRNQAYVNGVLNHIEEIKKSE